ncbi:MAG: dockerin type I repeat-containing protein, partial [Spirochaetales bacterium]|nr:dockerin type I repeat-containing protein [Spirochaetales bacterium]
TVDWQWQNAFLDYLAYENIFDTIYWSINPESYSVGGIYNHVYNPLNNTGGWGTWEVPDQRKLDLLYSFRNKDPRPGPVVRGDVNSDDTIDIVDALLTAQYYVGLYPHPFSTRNADVDCDGSVTIVDALLIARYYVGNLSSFTCS